MGDSQFPAGYGDLGLMGFQMRPDKTNNPGGLTARETRGSQAIVAVRYTL